MPARFVGFASAGKTAGPVTLITPMRRNLWLLANCLSKLLAVGSGLHALASAIAINSSNTRQYINQGRHSEEIISFICSLDVQGLSAGTYTVSVNGVSAEFTLDTDNVGPM